MNLSSSTRRSSSCQCTTTLHGEKKETQRIMLADSLAVVGLSGDLDQERNGTELTLINPTDPATNIAEQMMVNFPESCHPTFRASSAFQRGELRSKEHGMMSIHFNGSEENIELLLRTIISANQLSVYVAMADLCKEPTIRRFKGSRET